jgi:exopolyphosphatase/guanosine-5'-triphosphate,3'-diphosphate pyrophosphatase
VRRVEPVAAIDCGTNSTRLLVVDGDGQPVERLMRITRLGQGVDADRRLHPDAIARVAGVLQEFRAVLDRHQVTRVRAAATSAARDATNRDELFDAAEAAVGVRPELLDGMEEARLSFLGATADLPAGGPPLLVADIGGGSTELVVGVPGEEPIGAISLDIGCVRTTERWVEKDPPGPEALTNALGEARDLLEDADRQVPALREAQRMIGLAGTVSTVASLDLGLADYDRDKVHHHLMSRAVVEDWFRTMAMGDREDRLGNPGLEEGRADVIVGGMCVLVSIMRHRGFDACLHSEADILDGLCLTLSGR